MKNGDNTFMAYVGDGNVRNVKFRIENKKLYLEIPLDGETKPSYSGKTDVLSTSGQFGLKFKPEMTGMKQTLTCKLNAYYDLPPEIKKRRTLEAKKAQLESQLEKLNSSDKK